jgi:small subunit ribosomal protein S20
MPNTKSAERRMRSSKRKWHHNRSIKSRLKSLERAYEEAVKSGKKEAASTAYQKLSSAFDKAAKVGVIHSRTANRKKSRLSARLVARAA